MALVLALFALTAGPASGKPVAAAAPTVCRAGVHIENLDDFDLASDTFGAELWLWRHCPSRDPAPLDTIDHGFRPLVRSAAVESAVWPLVMFATAAGVTLMSSRRAT